jgi:hypothetical protein
LLTTPSGYRGFSDPRIKTEPTGRKRLLRLGSNFDLGEAQAGGEGALGLENGGLAVLDRLIGRKGPHRRRKFDIGGIFGKFREQDGRSPDLFRISSKRVERTNGAVH